MAIRRIAKIIFDVDFRRLLSLRPRPRVDLDASDESFDSAKPSEPITHRIMHFIPPGKVTSDTLKRIRADFPVLDMEDAIPLDKKVQTRRFYRETLLNSNLELGLFIRINPVSDDDSNWLRDLDQLTLPKQIRGFIVAKVQDRASVGQIDEFLRKRECEQGLRKGHYYVMATQESAKGILAGRELYDGGRVRAALIGDHDLVADLRCGLRSDVAAQCLRKAIRDAGARGRTVAVGPLIGIDSTNGLMDAIKKVKNMGTKGMMAVTQKQADIIQCRF